MPGLSKLRTRLVNALVNSPHLQNQPKQAKIEIKRVLESLYGFEVDEVRTLNMDGKKKKRGGLLIAKPDYKKAYVTLRNPLSISSDLYPIRVIEEERKNMSKQSKSTIVEGEETKKTHWLDGSGVKQQTGYNGKVWHRPVVRHKRVDTGNTTATSKFPWTSM